MEMNLQSFIFTTSVLLGFLSLCKTIITFINWVWAMFLRPAKNLHHYGSWAIVTGATYGIGKSLVFELASKGLNIVLTDRSSSRLEATKKSIIEAFGEKVAIKVIVLDFNEFSGEEICKRIESGIEGLDVGILINNAGVSNPYAKYFHEMDLDMIESIVKVNVVALSWVTKAVLTGMLVKKKGAIVNIGSASSVAASSYPLYSIYSATKAYAAMFSKCISEEYKDQGIDIQCQVPFFVATKMSRLKKSNFMVASPEMYSKASVRWIGYEQICTPLWTHSVQWWLAHALPDIILVCSIFRHFQGIRRRGLFKESKQV